MLMGWLLKWLIGWGDEEQSGWWLKGTSEKVLAYPPKIRFPSILWMTIKHGLLSASTSEFAGLKDICRRSLLSSGPPATLRYRFCKLYPDAEVEYARLQGWFWVFGGKWVNSCFKCMASKMSDLALFKIWGVMKPAAVKYKFSSHCIWSSKICWMVSSNYEKNGYFT